MEVLENINKAREGEFSFTLKITDPSGNSGIVSPKAKRTKLDVEREDGMSFVPYNWFFMDNPRYTPNDEERKALSTLLSERSIPKLNKLTLSYIEKVTDKKCPYGTDRPAVRS